MTVPYKHSSVNYLDELSLRAKALRAVNVIRSEEGVLIGDMVDGLGFLEALKTHAFDVRAKRVAIIGAGAAGSAIALALAESNPSHLTIHEVKLDRHPFLRSLVAEANSSLELSFQLDGLVDYDLIINASPVGMKGEGGMPFPMDDLQSETLIFDVVTQPRHTAWLFRALEIGCDVVFGQEMVQGQFVHLAKHLGLETPPN